MNQHQDYQFAFFSANLFQFLPSIPWTGHRQLFELYHEYHHARPIPIEWTGKICGYRPKEPGILATFHLGNHVEIPIALVQAGILFDIVIDQPTYERYRFPLSVANQRLVDRGDEKVNFLMSDDCNLFFKIKKSIKRGRHLLIFADGNGGMEQESKKDLIAIPFFSNRLWVKRGIPVLARLLNIPIYPLLLEDCIDSQNLEVFDPIFSNFTLDKSINTKEVLSQLYHILECKVVDDPVRWECWIYLHRNGMLQLDVGLDEKIYEPDLAAEAVVKLCFNKEYVWFDRKKYLLFRSV